MTTPAARPQMRPARSIAFPAALFVCVAAASLVLGIAVGALPSTPANRETFAGIGILAVIAASLVVLRRSVDGKKAPETASEKSFRAFFDHALEGIFRTTPDGHYLAANAALARIYGYDSPEELIEGLTDIGGQLYIDPGRRDDFLAEMREHGQVTDFVSRIRRRDGSITWISENSRSVRDWTGRVVFYEGTVEDVSAEREMIEAMRRALAEAEEASRAKSAFLAAMSHELKTPLNAVLGFSEILKGEMFGPLGDLHYREYASDIHASGTRLLCIVNDILDTARLQGGAITLVSRIVTAEDLIDQAVASARKTTGDVRDLEIHIAPGLPSLDVDAARIGQALANLVSNALKFTPDGGRISLRVAHAPVGGVNFVVRDSGIGMDADKIANALEPFRQLDRSLARRFEGAGLGLSIAKSLAELHGGSLMVASAPGKGTTVTLSIPPARVSARQLAAAF